MHKYRSKCRWNMLLHVDNEIVEIRPGEEFTSISLVTSRFLEELTAPPKIIKKGRPKKPKVQSVFDEELNGSSSST